MQVAEHKLAAVRAESLVRISRGSLNTAMGLPAELPIEIHAELPASAPPDGAQLAAAFDRALDLRPELKAALSRIARARSVVAAAQGDFGPQVKADARYGWRDSGFPPEDEDWAVGIGVELPVFSGFSSTHRLARPRRELSREEAQARQLVLAVRQEVWSAYSRLKEAHETLQAAAVLVADARESMRLVRQRYEAGTNTITDLLDAQTALARAESVQVEARWNHAIRKAVFDRASGRMAPSARG